MFVSSRVDDVAVGVDRAIDVADLVGVDLGDGEVELDLLLNVEALADVAFVGVDQSRATA